MAPFSMVRAGPEDMAAIVPLLYKSFSDKEVQMRFMGPDTPEQHEGLAQHFREDMKKDHLIWFKVVDKSNGHIAAASLWGLDLQGPFPKPDKPMERPWLAENPELEKKENEIMAAVAEERKKRYTMPNLKLHILCTDPAYNRRGAGAIMMKWGCALADQLSLDAFIEATEQGSHLYGAFGFKKLSDQFFGTGYFMHRDPEPFESEGGRDL